MSTDCPANPTTAQHSFKRPARRYLADYREVHGEAWLDQVDVLLIDRDYMIVKAHGALLGALPAHTILDHGDIDGARYLRVELTSATGRASAERLGTVLLERDENLLVRQEGEVASDFRMDGIHAIVQLRRLQLSGVDESPAHTAAFQGLVADIVGEVTETNYQATIQDLEDLVTRNARHANFMNACVYAHDVFESYGIPAEIEEYEADPWGGTPFTCWNVVAEKPGVVYPDSIYIICGHLDATVGSPSSPEPFAPGADDNASGSATVLEAARVMSPYDFKYTVRFLCFGAEEQGLCGSRVYAEAAAAAGEFILGVVNLDMLLFGPPGHDIVRVKYDGNSLPIAQAFDAAAAAYVPDLNVTLVYAPGSGGSDHYSFWQVGYRAVEGIEEYLAGNPHYHRTSDLLANYLAYFPFGTNCARAGISTVAALAEPEVPTGIAETPSAPAIERLTITSISPNPARDNALVTLRSLLDEPLSLTLFDIHGRALRRQNIEVDASEALGVRLGFSDLPSGIYLIRAEGGQASASRKMAITR
jgi:hypothetical protein